MDPIRGYAKVQWNVIFIYVINIFRRSEKLVANLDAVFPASREEPIIIAFPIPYPISTIIEGE